MGRRLQHLPLFQWESCVHEGMSKLCLCTKFRSDVKVKYCTAVKHMMSLFTNGRRAVENNRAFTARHRPRGCVGGCFLDIHSQVGQSHRVELVWECQILYSDDAICFEKKHNGTVRNGSHWVKIG